MKVLSKSPFDYITLSSWLSSLIPMMQQVNSHTVGFSSSSSDLSCSLHAIRLVQRVVEKGLRSSRHSGERSQRSMDSGRRGRGCGES